MLSNPYLDPIVTLESLRIIQKLWQMHEGFKKHHHTISLKPYEEPSEVNKFYPISKEDLKGLETELTITFYKATINIAGYIKYYRDKKQYDRADAYRDILTSAGIDVRYEKDGSVHLKASKTTV